MISCTIITFILPVGRTTAVEFHSLTSPEKRILHHLWYGFKLRLQEGQIAV